MVAGAALTSKELKGPKRTRKSIDCLIKSCIAVMNVYAMFTPGLASNSNTLCGKVRIESNRRVVGKGF